MSLKNYTKEEMQDLSLIELAKFILREEKETLKFKELFEKVCELKGLSGVAKDQKLSQFYTDLNVDGNFMNQGSNTWGLKSWFKVKEETQSKRKPRKVVKRRIKIVEDEDILDGELALIDGRIDAVEVNDLDEDFDEDLDLDFSEEEDLFEEDSY